MNLKITLIIAFCFLFVFSISMAARGNTRRELSEERLYNADQDRIAECGITHDPEYCHLLINGNCDE